MNIQEYLAEMEGQPCWHVSSGGVGTTFQLWLGDKVRRVSPLRNPRIPEEARVNRGSIHLLVWCSWRLVARETWGSSACDHGAEVIRELEGSTVDTVVCDTRTLDLRIGFEDGACLEVFADVTDKCAGVEENWELTHLEWTLYARSRGDWSIEYGKPIDVAD